MTGTLLSTSDFALAFSKFVENMNGMAPSSFNPFAERLRAHFGVDDLTTLVVLDRPFPPRDRTTVELALREMVRARGRASDLVAPTAASLFLPTFFDLVAEQPPGYPPVRLAAVERVVLPLPDGESLSCVKLGAYLVAGTAGERFVAHVSKHDVGLDKSLVVSFVARDLEQTQSLVAEFDGLLRDRSVHRGQVLSLDGSEDLGVQYHNFPIVRREDLVLPDRVIITLERLVVGYSRHAARLSGHKHHRRRGVLLHGRPGTGKTLIAKYLSRAIPGLTTFFLTGCGIRQLAETCALARRLQPSLVVLEDVDLIAAERANNDRSALLFELLNQMDGVGEDADITFLLTSNRPEVLEPALAARPGRIDATIELPLPDADARSRLIDLYASGLDCVLDDREAILTRTKGASPAFIRELVRRAALLAAEESMVGAIRIGDRSYQDALDELLVASGPFAKSLLGLHEADS